MTKPIVGFKWPISVSKCCRACLLQFRQLGVWLVWLMVISHIDDVIHHFLVLLLALFEKAAYLR